MLKRNKSKGRLFQKNKRKKKLSSSLDKNDFEMEVLDTKDLTNTLLIVFNAQRHQNMNIIAVNVAKNGGHVLWMLDPRDVEETQYWSS